MLHYGTIYQKKTLWPEKHIHTVSDYGIFDLELRRLHLDLICRYKIVFGTVNFSFSSFFKFNPVTNTRGHQYKLYKSHCSHSTRSRFFCTESHKCLELFTTVCWLGLLYIATFRRSIDVIEFTAPQSVHMQGSKLCCSDLAIDNVLGTGVNN